MSAFYLLVEVWWVALEKIARHRTPSQKVALFSLICALGSVSQTQTARAAAAASALLLSCCLSAYFHFNCSLCFNSFWSFFSALSFNPRFLFFGKKTQKKKKIERIFFWSLRIFFLKIKKKWKNRKLLSPCLEEKRKRRHSCSLPSVN